MLRLLVLVAAAWVATGTDVAYLQSNLTSLWEYVHHLEEAGGCSSQVNLVVHDRHPGGRPGHGPHGDNQEEEEDHDDDEHDHEHDGRHGHGGRNAVHLHLHVSGYGYDRPDIMHTMPFTREDIGRRRVYAVARMHGGLSGSIHFRQQFQGGTLELMFDVSGFDGDMATHEHALRIHRFGAGEGPEACANLGIVFAPPHDGRGMRFGGRGPHHHHRERRDHHVDHHDDHADDGSTETRHQEGDLGTVACDTDGNLISTQENDRISLVGFHNIKGRAIAIHESTDADSAVLACGTIGMSGGEAWGDEDDWADLFENL